MAEVITRLKVDNQGFDQKIKNAQRSLDQFGLKGSEAGKKLSGLTNMFSSGITKIGPWGAALGVASGALKVMGDAFKASETNMDSWRGTMEGMSSAYKSFLTALNTADFSNFFSSIKEVVSAARAAYDSMDNLGTYNAFAARGAAKNKAAYSEAVANYKENKSDENREAVRVASDAVIADLEQQKELTAKAYKDAVKKLALEQGMNGGQVDEFVEMFTNKSWAELSSAKSGYAKGKGLNGATYWNGSEVYGNDIVTRDKSGVAIERRAMTEAEQAAFKFARALNEVSDEAIQSTQALGAQEFQLDEAIANQRRNATRMLGGGAEPTVAKADNKQAIDLAEAQRIGRGMLERSMDPLGAARQAVIGNETAVMQMQFDFSQLDEAEEEAEIAMADAFQSGSLDDLKNKLAEATAYMESLTVDTEEWKNALDDVVDAQDALNAAQEKMASGKGMATVAKDATNSEDAFRAAASAVANVSGALQGLEDPGAKIAGIIGQAIANIALSFSGSLKGTWSPWDWIAAAAAGTATMVSTITAIKSATSGYAEGGLILPNGSPYQGDNIVARLNAGEGVLTADGIENAGRLASQTNVGSGMLGLRTEISGENIAVVLDNNNRRRGRSKSVR